MTVGELVECCVPFVIYIFLLYDGPPDNIESNVTVLIFPETTITHEMQVICKHGRVYSDRGMY